MHYTQLDFKRSTFLITGGAGFIGSNLCEALLNMGQKVKCLDNLSTGFIENINPFFGNTDFEFIQGDIRSFETCLEACNDVDYVLHQAAWGSVPRSIEFPLLYEDINIKGTLNMLEAARVAGVKKFVYASSSSVYGDEANLPKVEGREGNLLSPYAITKRVDEEYGKLYAKVYGLDTYGLRYFNVFGKRQNPEGPYAAVIPKFIMQMNNHASPVIHGDGTQSRDFTFIENVVDANLKACKAGKEAAGDVYNIASGSRVTLNELYAKLCGLTGIDGKPVYDEERQGDIKHSHADISKAMRMLGYEVGVTFDEGLKRTVAYFKGQENG
jgi:UDP-N-acetylglucosamine 4-epimerase